MRSGWNGNEGVTEKTGNMEHRGVKDKQSKTSRADSIPATINSVCDRAGWESWGPTGLKSPAKNPGQQFPCTGSGVKHTQARGLCAAAAPGTAIPAWEVTPRARISFRTENSPHSQLRWKC